jgi:hypothetical protein
VKREF